MTHRTLATSRTEDTLFTQNGPANRELLAGQKLPQQVLSQKKCARTAGMNRRIVGDDAILGIYEVRAPAAPPNAESRNEVAHG